MYGGHPLGEDAVLGPGEHHAGDGEQHGRQVVDERHRGPGEDRGGAGRGQQIAEQPRRGHVADGRFLGDELPRHGVVHRGGEQEIETADRGDRDPDGERNVAAGVLRLAAGLRDRVEPDEGGEEHDGRGHERDELERRGGRVRDRPALGRHQRGGEVPVVEREAADDDHRAEREHEEHHRDQGPLVELQPPHVHQHEGPEEGDRDADPHRAALEGCGNRGVAQRAGHVADEGNEQVRHHPDGDGQPEPLGETGDETPPGAERAARVHVASPGAGHRRSQAAVGKRGQHGWHGREDVGRQDVGADLRDAPEQGKRHHVDRRAEHGADSGGGEPHEAQVPGKPGARCCSSLR